MEEDKAAAYYDELSRQGEGAARFKQGLGFSSSSSDPFPSKRAPNVSSPLFSSFVRASSPSKATELDKQAQLDKIHNKLKKPPPPRGAPSPPPSPNRDRRRHRSRERDDRRSDARRRYSSRERRRESDDGGRRRDGVSNHRSGSGRRRSRSRSRSRSPRRDSHNRNRGHWSEHGRDEKHKSSKKSGTGAVDYSQLIEGYSKMTPAEKVKAKMKLQLSETAAKDTVKGSGWERFDFNQEAPVDGDNDDAPVEIADDDAAVVKSIEKTFRLSAVERKREDEIKAAHDEAMFGTSATLRVLTVGSMEDDDATNDTERQNTDAQSNVLVSDKVIAMQQTSWRDRARRHRGD